MAIVGYRIDTNLFPFLAKSKQYLAFLNSRESRSCWAAKNFFFTLCMLDKTSAVWGQISQHRTISKKLSGGEGRGGGREG